MLPQTSDICPPKSNADGHIYPTTSYLARLTQKIMFRLLTPFCPRISVTRSLFYIVFTPLKIHAGLLDVPVKEKDIYINKFEHWLSSLMASPLLPHLDALHGHTAVISRTPGWKPFIDCLPKGPRGKVSRLIDPRFVGDIVSVPSISKSSDNSESNSTAKLRKRRRTYLNQPFELPTATFKTR